MARTGGLRQVTVADLFLDEDNPRLEEPQSQAQILEAWAREAKNYRLAKSVAANGLSPLEVIATIPHPDIPKRLIVVDGNRRLTALKLLHNPGLAGDSSRTHRYRQLAKPHKLQQTVTCMVFASREEADPWIELRHSGEAGGVGTVSWSSAQKYRFNARRNKPDRNEDAVRFLDSAVENNWISEQQRRSVPVTTLRRVLDSKDARASLGIRITSSGPVVARPAADAAKLVRVLIDALSKKGVVREIDRKDARSVWVLDQIVAANLKPATAPPVEEQDQGKEEMPAPRPRRRPAPKKQRTTLVPKKVEFAVSQPRCDEIFGELGDIQVGRSPNAVVVLFRVFIEFTADHFLEKRGARPGSKTSLLAKIRSCVEKLEGTPQALTDPKKQALEKILASQNHPLNPDTLNAFVHNLELRPLPSDLPKLWDQIEAFVAAVWRNLEAP